MRVLGGAVAGLPRILLWMLVPSSVIKIVLLVTATIILWLISPMRVSTVSRLAWVSLSLWFLALRLLSWLFMRIGSKVVLLDPLCIVIRFNFSLTFVLDKHILLHGQLLHQQHRLFFKLLFLELDPTIGVSLFLSLPGFLCLCLSLGSCQG
mmetsp:Transcript_11223/g.14188  ORF Transcript_11223/g.14188 Transcript_11223/m.14188 type:complete len:151 (+) Transcript_11223:706-1158(+)